MSDKLRKVIAWIGLFFALIFSVALILTLAGSKIFGGAIGYVALAAFFPMIIAFCLIYFDNRARRAAETKLDEEAEKKRQSKLRREEIDRLNAEKNAENTSVSEDSKEGDGDNAKKD